MASSANQNEIEYLLNNKGIFALNINLNFVIDFLILMYLL